MDRLQSTRRDFLSGMAAGAGLLIQGCNSGSSPGQAPDTAITSATPADVTLRIDNVQVEIAKEHTISTIGYNGTVPGPPIRLHEGVPVTLDLFNETDVPELVHWHGQFLPADIDGALEEKSRVVPAHGHLRYRLTPQPAGARFVHTHVMPMADLNRGTYTGQFAFVYIEPKSNPGQYDQEIFLATHEWEPIFTAEEEEDDEDVTPAEKQRAEAEKKSGKPNGWEIGYQRFTINGKCLGFGEPLRVKQGQRVLFHILNASATENIKLALPGHRFQVVALDGNVVPRPQLVDVLELGTAERISALVEMKTPGVWILGTPKDDDRKNGMGIVVEYANQNGAPRWTKLPKQIWDYTQFGENRPAPAADEVIPLVFGKVNGGTGGFNRWTINGKSYDEKAEPRLLHKGKRYRLVFDNQTDDPHPVHLHRNSFELTSVYGKPSAGVLKDVVLVKGFRKIEADFTPAMDGLTLFHCHQQFHMDYGFKLLFNVA
ncbi:MAG TPA: multicopper oxidase domain-containing protein [Bryobacteraceae bacterium]|jgi:FtsP/CotA-like multicopper oxidase with cupredoxin domain|nr:multicopper oxidase domain-containing protein [Bryobacteraceae bacterium]